MTIAIISGLDKLNRHYTELAKTEDLQLRVFSRYTPNLLKRISQTDGVIMFTGLMSHKSAQQVYKLARDDKINLVCCHKCSLSAMKDCISELKKD